MIQTLQCLRAVLDFNSHARESRTPVIPNPTNDSFTIYIFHERKKRSVAVSKRMSIRDLRQAVQRITNIKVEKMDFELHGKPLGIKSADGSKTLADFPRITSESVLYPYANLFEITPLDPDASSDEEFSLLAAALKDPPIKAKIVLPIQDGEKERQVSLKKSDTINTLKDLIGAWFDVNVASITALTVNGKDIGRNDNQKIGDIPEITNGVMITVETDPQPSPRTAPRLTDTPFHQITTDTLDRNTRLQNLQKVNQSLQPAPVPRQHSRETTSSTPITQKRLYVYLPGETLHDTYDVASLEELIEKIEAATKTSRDKLRITHANMPLRDFHTLFNQASIYVAIKENNKK